MQKDQTVEKLGLQLMKLAKKAFPSLGAKELDRLLKGRFYQSLLPKWQRKLGAPKLEESFNALYERARTCERHDQQYRSTRESHGLSISPKPQNSGTKNREATEVSAEGKDPPRKRQSSIKCFGCQELGHFKCNCPKLQKDKSEAPGSSSKQTESSSTAAIGAQVPASSDVQGDPLSALSDEQLEDILRHRRCQKEQGMLSSTDVQIGAVLAAGLPVAVGPTLELDVRVEGVQVTAMVDTGSQSSIISRSLLHRVGRHLRKQGNPVPKLEPASVRLYGKDGAAGQHELNVTAQVTLPVETGSNSVQTVFFVQPDSSQDCLIGMNAAPALGLSFLDRDGKPLRTASAVPTTSSSVSLVQTKAIPARARSFVEAGVDAKLREGACVLFEPDSHSLQMHGLGALESLVSVNKQGNVLIPVENYHQREVHIDRGTLLGRAEVLPGECQGTVAVDLPEDEAYVAVVHSDTASRKQTLLEAVKWSSSVTPAELAKLKTVVADYNDVFALSDEDLGCTDVVKHKIDTADHVPIKQYPRRTPFAQRAKIAAMIADMERKGVVSPSVSPWASPIVLVPKKDGTTRFCVDFRRLNAITKKDVYPLPRIEDILDTLGRAQYFTTLDLSAGYWQIQLDASSKEKTAFTTHCGLFQFNRMPFGLCNAPSTFQRLMQTVLVGLEGKTCFVYIDDILVCSRTFDDHVRHLQAVFDRLRTANLKLKVQKCVFLRDEVQYLGHTISKHGIAPDPSKVSKVQNFPVPTDLNKLRQFLGLASYYRRFIKNFAAVAAPLHALTKKDVSYVWTVQCQEAFQQLKQLLCSAPVLAYPQFGPGHQFVLETDASLAGLGAVLSQNDDKGHLHPVAYASRALHKHEVNYHITELETLGIVWAVKYFRAYLLGHHCVVLTDHAACTSLLNSTNPSAKLARWAMIVQEMDLDIRYRSGKSNCSADALSRNPVADAVVSCVTAETTDFGLEQRSDSEFKPLIDYLEKGILPADDAAARKLVINSEAFDLTEGIL